MTMRLGIDVGGTFTDVVFLKDGEIYRGKSDTTHYDLKLGFMNATRVAVGRAGLELEEALRGADAIVYSTTVGTNALIERRGTKLGLITTKGFEHTVHVGRARNWGDGLPTEKKYDRGRAVRPVPILPQDRIVSVQERIDNLGNVIIPLRDDDVRRQVQYLVDQGVRGFVVVLLNAYVNPMHERRIAELIAEQYPDCYLGHMPIFLSHEISPKSGEYRRSMTVIIDAYLRDLTEGHLLRLSDDLRDVGYRRPVFVAKNTGGLSSLSRTQALHLLGSSPSATVIGSDYIGKAVGHANVVVSDMGGTSFDVGLVVEGRDRVYEYDPVVERYRVQIPYVAHWSVGAGGGSIARIENGALRVGPQSAGSNPGPACYNRGGEDATVTDSDVILGYINPDNFLGGKLRIDHALAERAVRTKIAEPLGVPLEEAAWNIKRLIDGFMGQEMYRICALTSGQDPRDFVLFALGGAGPVHATGYADGTDVGRIATFPFSSVFGAFSTLTLDVLQTYEKTLNLNLYAHRDESYAVDNIARFNAEIDRLMAFARRDMTEEGFDMAGVQLQVEIHMCYGQQRQTLPIRVPKGRLENAADVKYLCDTFNAAYGEKYGKGAVYPEAGVEMVEMRLNAVGPAEKYQLRQIAADTDPERSRTGTRNAYWGPSHGWMMTPVYARESLGAGIRLPGPVLCEAEDTVIVTPPGWTFRVDDWNVGWIERNG
ncbi:MAG: hydantoinase/oxoprolinase family protein [Alphaproteobacteria bacterium]|nr:hydantoinase/oxoprolinase family protein [Alphaproteobacteria bacterium]